MKKTSWSEAPAGARARATYGRVLDAAEGLLASGGFDAMTTTAVADAAGVSTGTVYTYFADKHAILAALFARRLDDLVVRVEQVLTSDRLLDEGLEATVDQAVTLVVEGYRAHAATLRTALARVSSRPELRSIYWDRHARATEAVERFLRRGAAAGLVRGGDGAVVAQTMLLVTQGLNHPVMTDGPRHVAAGVRREVVSLLAVLLAPRPHRQPGAPAPVS